MASRTSRTSRTSDKQVNEIVQGNMIAIDAPVTRVLVNTAKVAKFNTALRTKNEGGGYCFTSVTVFKKSFDDATLDQLDAVLENCVEYDRKTGEYSDYLADCDHLQISGHLASESWEDKKGTTHTNIVIVADMIDLVEE